MAMQGRGIPVTSIEIVAEGGAIDETAIKSSLGLTGGISSYDLHLDALLARVLSVPDVEFASVRRANNGNLKIKLWIKKTVAVWTDGTHFYPMAANGTIINRVIEKPADVLVFHGIMPGDVSGIVDAMSHHPKLFAKTEYIEMIEGRRWNLHINVSLRSKSSETHPTAARSPSPEAGNTITVMLPEFGFGDAIKKLADLDYKKGLLNRKIKIVDMRDPSRILVTQ